MSETARPRGRPKSADKRDAVLDAARALFLEHGGDAVPLDSVIARAGVSKANFYSNFADRSALLEAVIRREAERVILEGSEHDPASAGLRPDLEAFGFRLLRLLTDPDIIGFERLIATGSRAHPDLAGRFFQAGPGQAFDTLVARIELGMLGGELRTDDPRRAADDLVGLWQGFMRVELGLGARKPPGETDLQIRADRGVQLFLTLYAKA